MPLHRLPICLLLSGALVSLACSDGNPSDDSDNLDNAGGAGGENGDEESVLFDGTASNEDCSGFLAKFEGQPDESPAWVLTNGHCLGVLLEDGPLVDEKLDWSIDFRFFNENGDASARYSLDTVAYATMQGTDVALLRLDDSYTAIEEDTGATALTVARRRADLGEAVRVISAQIGEVTECVLDAVIPTVEEDVFVWNDSLRLSRGCETTFGTSGAPIVSMETGMVVGINNTGVPEGEANGEPCTLNFPCEKDDSGEITFTEGSSYGQQLDQIYGCLDDNFEFDLTLVGCDLEKP